MAGGYPKAILAVLAGHYTEAVLPVIAGCLLSIALGAGTGEIEDTLDVIYRDTDGKFDDISGELARLGTLLAAQGRGCDPEARLRRPGGGQRSTASGSRGR